MDHFIELDTIVVVAITLAALTSILAALRGGHWHEWAPRFRLGFWMLVQYCLGVLGFSLLPSLLRDLVSHLGGCGYGSRLVSNHECRTLPSATYFAVALRHRLPQQDLLDRWHGDHVLDIGVARLVPIRGPGRPDLLPRSLWRLDLSPGILGRLRRVPAP